MWIENPTTLYMQKNADFSDFWIGTDADAGFYLYKRAGKWVISASVIPFNFTAFGETLTQKFWMLNGSCYWESLSYYLYYGHWFTATDNENIAGATDSTGFILIQKSGTYPGYTPFFYTNSDNSATTGDTFWTLNTAIISLTASQVFTLTGNPDAEEGNAYAQTPPASVTVAPAPITEPYWLGPNSGTDFYGHYTLQNGDGTDTETGTEKLVTETAGTTTAYIFEGAVWK